MNDIERRYTPGRVETRAAVEGNRIGGYAAVFNKLSRNMGGFTERVNPAAFNGSKAAGWPDVVARFNHDPQFILGTTGGKTLLLRTDGAGLDYVVDPPKSRRDIVELVERGDVRHSSFAFRCLPGGDDWGMSDQGYPLRSLMDVQLIDVAPVVAPAYPDATAGLRSLAARFDATFDDVKALAQANELRRFFARSDGPVSTKLVHGRAALAVLDQKRVGA